MSTDFLSQDEVDALLQGVTGEPGAAAEPQPPGGVRSFDLSSQDRAQRGRLLTLESINESFSHRLRSGIIDYARRTPEISVGAIKIQSYADFTRSLLVPASINLLRLKPLRGTALVVLDPALVSSVVDSLFGGSGRLHTPVDGRDFTQTEQRIIQRLLGIVTASLENAWAPVHPLTPEYLRSELSMQLVNIGAPADLAAVTTFSIEFGADGGDLHICLPYSMIEPIRDRLSGTVPGEDADPDQAWVRRLSSGVQSAAVEMVVNLGRAEVSIQQLLAMQVGDVISLEIPQPLVAEVDRVPVMECKCGILNGQYALKVERLLAPCAP
ncbi:MAG: flagellar motor switch protein FliM [Betaproteobacteria bacterium]|jgi:flagellar motor switch protein FliM